jgi:hypothetical protein
MTKRQSQNTCWQKCLAVLIRAQKTAYPWVPGWFFTPPEIGGLNGTRRVRELRTKFGIPYECKKIDGKWLYRLGCPPDEIDLRNICLKPKLVEPEIKEQLILI